VCWHHARPLLARFYNLPALRKPRRLLRALLPLGRPLYIYTYVCHCTHYISYHSRVRPDDARGYGVSWCPAANSDLPLLVPLDLIFTVVSDQKAPCYILITLDPIVAVCCHPNTPLSFLSTGTVIQ
jgi:hypothetical protein